MMILKSYFNVIGNVCFLIAAGCFPASGQQPDSVYNRLKEVEVVGNRVKESVTSTAPLFKLDEAKMKSMGVTDLTDALHRMPGLNIRDYGGAGGMKTVSVRGFGSTHTGVIYDGVSLSDAQTGTIDLSRYSLDNVDDLSLIIGDNSDIFTTAKAASSAASIIINTGSVPSTADSLFHLTAQMRVGSFWLINPYVKVGKSFNKRFAFSAIGEYIYGKNDYPFTLRNGILVTRERRDNSRMNSGHGELNLRWRPTLRSALDAKVYFYDNNRQLPGPVILYNPISDDTLHDRNFFGQVSYSNNSLSKFRFRAIAKFNWDATDYHEVDGKYPGGELYEKYVQRETYVSGSVLYLPLEKLSLSYAADYSYNNLTANNITLLGPWRHSIIQSLSAKFRTDHLQLTGRLLCSVFVNGVQKGEKAPDRTKLSPSLSLSVQPWQERLFFIRASYKNIFRVPTFNETYYYHLGSSSLKPETTDQVNLGVTWQYGPQGSLTSLTFTADAYYNHVKDKIVAIPQNMFVWSMMNIDKARAIGADFTLEAKMTIASRQSLLLAGNYSFQRVQPRTSPLNADYNKQVAYTPVNSGAASLTWQNPWVDVVVKATAVGERFGTNTNIPLSRLAPYWELGASLMHDFRFRRHSLEIRGDLLNILDRQYEIVADYPMPGRSWRLTATFTL